MKTYFYQAKMSFMGEFVYRKNTIFTVIGNLFALYITIAIWQALYSGKGAVAGITFQQMIVYIMAQNLISSLNGRDIARDIASKIKTGDIFMYFIRPISLKWSSFSNKIGRNLFFTVFGTFPVLVVAFLIFNFQFPNLIYLLMFFISVLLSVVLMFFIDYVLSLFTFWLKSGVHISFFIGALFSIFSGSAVPLWFYPSWLMNIANALPFKFVYFEPVQIFMGKVSYVESIKIICYQLLWIFILFLLEKIIWKKAQKVVTIQGG